MTARNWRGASWETGFEFLRALASQTGTANPPSAYVTPEGFRLGAWLNTQRVWLRDGKLSAVRKAQLDELGVVWDPRLKRQEEMFEAIRDFHASHGHIDIPVRYRDKNNRPIGPWLRDKRQLKSSGKLTPKTLRFLEELGVVWEPSLDASETWFEALARFRDANGHTRIPSRYVSEDGLRVGVWLAGQISDIRTGKAPNGRAERLRAAGVNPEDDAREIQWNRMFSLLSARKMRNGHTNVQSSFVTPNGDRLGQWVGVQRAWKSQGRLKPEREAKLNEIDFSWGQKNSFRTLWTPESALAAIREAGTFEFPLTWSKFSRLIDDGLVSGPSMSYFVDHFGSWSRACELADVESGARPTFRFTENLILAAIRDFLNSKPSNPSRKNYEVWTVEQEGRPSSAVVRSNFGTWQNGVQAALDKYPDLVAPTSLSE